MVRRGTRNQYAGVFFWKKIFVEFRDRLSHIVGIPIGTKSVVLFVDPFIFSGESPVFEYKMDKLV